ncbi:MAG: hypothetical protein J6Q38_04960 [Clostridia bacterium]|nr:hypothetical protein [Clostridia bacterium]
MGKILKAEYNKENLTKLFNKKVESKDYEGALYLLNTMREKGVKEYVLYRNYARVHFFLGNYEKALNFWFCFLTVCDKNLKAVAYNGLGACFYKLENYELAGYYFNEQISVDKGVALEYNDYAVDFYDEITNLKDKYYLAYPYEKANFEPLFKNVTLLIKSGYFKEAIKSLEIVPEKSKYYAEALSKKALCKFLTGDVKGALNDVNESIKVDDKNVITLFNATSMFYASGEVDVAKGFLELLVSNKEYNTLKNADKLSMIYAEIGDYENAEINLEKALLYSPCKLTCMFLQGITKYNLTKYEEAYACFLKLDMIDKSFVTNYYLNLSKQAIIKQKKGVKIKKLEYTFDLPHNAMLRINNLFFKVVEEGISTKKQLEKLLKMLDYAFNSRNLNLQAKALKVLNIIEPEISIGLIKKYLVNVETFDSIKRSLIALLIIKGYSGEFKFVFGNIYNEVKISLPDFINDKCDILKEAYAVCISKIAPLEKDLHPVYLATKDLIGFFLEDDFYQNFTDVYSLSAVIFELSKIKKIRSRRDFLKFFSAKARTVKKYKDLIYDKRYKPNEEFENLLKEISLSLDEKDKK